MTLRLKIILSLLGIVVALMIIFSGIYLVGLFTKGKKAPATNQQPPATQGGLPQQGGNGQNQNQPPTVQAPVAPPKQKPGDELVPIVLPFVERFGSYSNQGNFENLTDLLPFMTNSMKQWANKQIQDQKSKPFQTLYHGVTTKSLSYTLSSYDAGAGNAEMKISTQRQELIGTTKNARIYNQDIVIKFKKVDNTWLVDSAYWQ